MESRAVFTMGEELGLTSEESWPPVKAATLTGLPFATVSLVPILPFAFMEVTSAAITAVIAIVTTLFGVGASKAIFTRKNWLRSGDDGYRNISYGCNLCYGIGNSYIVSVDKLCTILI